MLGRDEIRGWDQGVFDSMDKEVVNGRETGFRVKRRGKEEENNEDREICPVVSVESYSVPNLTGNNMHKRQG